VIAAQNRPVQVACRILGVSESGYYEQRKHPPSERAVRHAMLTDLITQVHADSHGTYAPSESTPSSPWDAASRSATTRSSCWCAGPACRPPPAGGRGSRSDPTPSPPTSSHAPSPAAAPNQLWVTDFERHEALLNRVEVKDLSQQRGEAEGSLTPGTGARAEAALTTTGQASTARWSGLG
jgi:putative transposase